MKINNYFKRFILWFVLLVFSFFIFSRNIFIWQPRPNWLKGIFSYKSFSLPFILPKKNIIYFGDGFLSLCKTESPFWLIENSKKVLRYKKTISKNHIFYYLFNIDYKEESVNEIKIESDFVNKIIDDLIKIEFNNIKKLDETFLSLKKKELFIFPTSTFYETSRANLKNEVEMYFEYIISKTRASENIICIKPHPGTNCRKTVLIEKTKK